MLQGSVGLTVCLESIFLHSSGSSCIRFCYGSQAHLVLDKTYLTSGGRWCNVVIGMLIGEYQTKLTDKNRLALPKQFRELLGDDIVVTKGYEGCLILTSKDAFSGFVEPLSRGPFFSKSVRDSTRFLVGSAHNVQLDAQGRFVLPKPLKEFSGVSGDVVFTGLNKWVEIWDTKKWEERMAMVETDASEIAEQLNNEFNKAKNNE